MEWYKTKLKKSDKEPGRVGFKINEFKTKEMRVKPSTNMVLTTNSRDVEQMKSFTYPGSIITIDGGALEGEWALCAIVPSLEEKIYLRNKIWLCNTNI